MSRFHCFSALLGSKKKQQPKESPSLTRIQQGNVKGILQMKSYGIIDVAQVKPEVDMFHVEALSKEPLHNTKAVGGDEKSIKGEWTEEAAVYEGGDEHDEATSMKRDYSDFDLQALACKEDLNFHDPMGLYNEDSGKSGHVSDPDISAMTIRGSPSLHRSCSNIETGRTTQLLEPPTRTHSQNELNLNCNSNGNLLLDGMPRSPFSVMTSCSTDRVMLKKQSSSELLPSRSRKLWWKLYLWSHRNPYNPWRLKPHGVDIAPSRMTKQKGGYSSDTPEPNHEVGMRAKMEIEVHRGDNGGELWDQSQWFAFSVGSSPLDGVNAWLNSLDTCPLIPDADEIEKKNSSIKEHSHATSKRLMEEAIYANNLIQSLNLMSTTAHMSGMGLKVLPAISAFASLRAVNLSGNLLAHITPGSLPKSLHTLDLSRNQIVVIEGLRDLMRLRVLNLSYNRILRIGHGLSNCTLIKELYLAGNKISEVEGLHRLLKLTVLDLSLNRITTSKALGQLVANYSSLMALNLLGNAIQSNIGDDHLRKAVSGLLPHLAYLNKQSIKPQRGRDAATDSVAKAALGDGGWGSRRRLARRSSQGSGSSSARGSKAGEGSGSVAGGSKSSKYGSKVKHRHSSSSRN